MTVWGANHSYVSASCLQLWITGNPTADFNNDTINYISIYTKS